MQLNLFLSFTSSTDSEVPLNADCLRRVDFLRSKSVRPPRPAGDPEERGIDRILYNISECLRHRGTHSLGQSERRGEVQMFNNKLLDTNFIADGLL